MVNTKQTKHGASSHRPVGMKTARFGNEGQQGQQGQFENIGEEDWRDLDAPQAVTEKVMQVSQQVKKVTNPPPHKLKKEHKHLLQMTPTNPRTHKQVLANRSPPTPRIPKQVQVQMTQALRYM